MLNYSYYPFKNKIEEIDFNDLLILREVSEGWYIDYKVQGLKITDFAKHLSAFANQYGGWLIIGISEAPDGSRTASEFLGIPNEQLEKLSRDIREASAAHVNPEVLYEEKVIKGPLEDIGLAEGKSILVIGIPMSHNTPHIHASGRIYRRLADQSKPKEETDRYILDELWRRGKNHQDKIKDFLKNIPELPESQSDNPWVHIYFKPADGQLAPKKSLSFDEFSKIVRNTNNDILGVHAPMQAINTTANGFIARQIENNDPSLASLTIRWWHGGRVRFDIPLNQFDFKGFIATQERNKYAFDFCKLAHEVGFKDMKIVDYSMFIQILASLSISYIHMLNLTSDKRDIYSCYTLRNVFHTSPYVDSELFMKRIREFSLPLTVDRIISIPSEPTEETMFFHPHKDLHIEHDSYERNKAVPFIFSLPLIYQIFESVGIISNIDDLTKDNDIWGFSKVNNATNTVPNQTN
ncbi:AlbA family DNA-binding domain-containing protein [Shewanella oncorhynchi]|uniref:AlbA family DNA-binding domain-containing protein n=1 Tax=Shewanella oncorhynchi TaxID=2726434 RepID=UPI003D7AF0DB